MACEGSDADDKIRWVRHCASTIDDPLGSPFLLTLGTTMHLDDMRKFTVTQLSTQHLPSPPTATCTSLLECRCEPAQHCYNLKNGSEYTIADDTAQAADVAQTGKLKK